MTASDKAVMQQALDALEWFIENDDTNIGQDGNEFWENGLNRGITVIPIIKEAIAQPVQPDASWKEAVLNELIVAHIYTADHDTNPRKAVQDAISWHCHVALDPSVSSDAQALVDSGKAQPVQPVAATPQAVSDAYEQVDRYLRNNLHDNDYADYSNALETVFYATTQPQQSAAMPEPFKPLPKGPWKTHYPQCVNCDLAYLFDMKDDCGWACDGVNMFSNRVAINPTGRTS